MAHATQNEKSKTKQKCRVSLVLLALGFMTGTQAHAHGGGLNAQGCHNNRKTGDYHCHRTQQVPAPTPSQFVADERAKERRSQELVTKPEAPQLQSNISARPTCHTGPRGGTYTITASGRKNYSGC
jgi:hypothetical protein